MAAYEKQLQFLRGSTASNETYTGIAGSLSVDTGKKTLRVHDGVTAGGSILAKEGIKLKTDSDNLLKFNAAAEADHSADISITLDKEAVSSEVITAIKADEDLKSELATTVVETISADEDLKGDVAQAVIDGIEADETKKEALAEDLAAKLVSTDTDNALKVGADNLLYVEEMDVEALVKADDNILSVGDDNKIMSTLAFNYTVADGKFKVTGKDGAQIYETTIPTSLTLLKTAEVVTDPAGQAAGTYLHFVFDLQSGQESEVYVNVTSFIDVYTAGDGLQVNAGDDHKFEVKVASTGNLLKIDDSKALFVPTDFGTLD